MRCKYGIFGQYKVKMGDLNLCVEYLRGVLVFRGPMCFVLLVDHHLTHHDVSV
jgi:hypothetical protein